MKGLIHIHSNYSDGELSLQEIKKEANSLGIKFVLMADHMEYFSSQEQVDKFVKECDKLSGEDFLMVPGLEISPKGDYHIIVYNGREFIKADSTIDSLVKIKSTENQFLVLAHASHYSGILPSKIVEKLNGVEVWNAKYDSKHAPSIKSYSFLEGNNLVAMAGLDSHSRVSLNKLVIEVDIDNLNILSIFKSFRDKNFLIYNKKKKININRPFSLCQKIYFLLINFLYFLIRVSFIFFSKLGINYPKILRKIFHKLF
jgi:hypothetical protein